MSRALVHLNLWLFGALLVVGLPLLTVALQATVRRLVPGIVKGDHNDVAGFLIAVVGVVCAVTLAFIVIVTWESYLAGQILVILVLSHPFSGDLAVSPDPFLRVVRDFSG